MHICDEVCFFNNVIDILRTTSLPVFTLRTDTVMTMTLVQMHAPSLEAVNPITLFQSSCQIPPSPPPSVRASLFFPPPAAILSEEHGRTSTQRGWRSAEKKISTTHLSSRPRRWTRPLSPSVVSSGADDEAIAVCEAYVSQVSRMAQKAFVFGLKQMTFVTVNNCACQR